MADSKTDLSASIVGGSDVIFDFYCEPCDSENQHVEAFGYCDQCQEYMCESCIKHHRKYAAFRSHKILDIANMPKGKIIPKVRDVLMETCPKHVDKVLEYFCDIHKELCCSVCLNTTHKKCKDTSYIPDVSDGAVSSREFKELVTKFDQVITMATNEQMKHGLTDSDNDAYRSKAVANIKAFRKEVDKELDRAEKDAINKVSALHQENSDRVKSAAQKCQSVLSDATAITTGLVEKSHANKKNQLFVDMKLATNRLAVIENEIKDAADCKISRYVFNQDEKVQTMVASLSAIWSLSVRHDGENIEARYLRDVKVKATEDTHDCDISGIAVLTGGRIVVTDINNRAVKLVDRDSNKVMSRLSMLSTPYALTKIDHNHVAISLSDVKKIEILTVADVLSNNRTIDVPDGSFDGIAFCDDTFILIYPYSREVKTFDMSGRVLRTVFEDNDSDPLFKFPSYIALNPCKDVIYITDYKSNTVTAMNLEGLVISICRHRQLESPYGVTVGRDGTVFVCSSGTDTVHQLTATGQHVTLLLDEQRGLQHYPKTIAYDEDGSRLCVGSANPTPEDSNNVRLFELK